MTREKILILAESLDVEDSSGTKGRVALIRNLNSLGYQLKVYHYTRKNIQIDEIECVSIKENRSSLLFLLSRMERYARYILKLKLYKPLENVFGFSFTLLNDRNSIVKSLKKIEKWDPDLIITLSKGGSFRPHHAVLKMPELHSKWMAYMHDPYPMHWYPPPYPWFEPGYRQKEKFMKQVADRCFKAVFPSQLLLEWMGDKYEAFKKKGVVIPHQLDQLDIPKMDVPRYIDFNRFNIVHAGNLIRGREPFGLISGFKKFLDNNPEAKINTRLLMIGGANYYSDYLKKNEDRIDQIILSDRKLSFELVQNIQSKVSINVILEAKSEISPFLPGKFPHCVKANNPILYLGPKKSESRRLLGEEYKYCSEIDNEELIADLISELYEEWKIAGNNLELNRPDLNYYLSKDNLEKTMKSIFNKDGYLSV